MVRSVLYGGKGGAGKTTLAAATGRALARDLLPDPGVMEFRAVT